MTIYIKTPEEIAKMRISGKLASKVLEIIQPYVKEGVSTNELNQICHQYITKIQKATPAPLGYQGFPKSVCISINNEVCHGIPNDKKKLQQGDIVNIDVTIIKNGWHGDTSKMFIVGKTNIIAKKLCDTAKESLNLAINIIKPGIRLYKIGKIIQNYVEKKNFSIVREYCGHGIGKHFHESPQILHYKADDGGIILKEGMTITIEPMINIGNYQTYVAQDGWTVKTKDNSLSAQYEHTIAVTANGCEILTLRSDDILTRFIHHAN